MKERLDRLGDSLEGTLHTGETMRRLYATDASSYRELPTGVVFPRSVEDLKKLVAFARQNKIGLIPRTAGTSLAGQVVGNGLIVDVSRHFNQILEVNTEEKWVRLQPGVVRDDLNRYLKPYGLYFGPETSTANRAMVGGMAGNNSCGSNSVVYGSTRDHMVEMKVLLDDGTEQTFGQLEKEDFEAKQEAPGTEGRVYRDIADLLKDANIRQKIHDRFPKVSIPRRNTGYALDLLALTEVFDPETKEPFNFCKLLCGAEGTLGITTELKLSLVPTPPPEKGLMCIHFESIHESLVGNLTVLQHKPSASELMDHYILECTKGNIETRQYRFFVKGDPQAILVAELSCETREELETRFDALETALREEGLGYHYPRVYGADVSKVWKLRKAGLGLLSNIPGDAKAVPVIEDTAVDVRDLPAYIQAFNEILKKYDLYAVHYAHAGTGELHLRPIINLKTAEGHELFRTIATEVALLVKQFNGSLSGEHGDGRLRGEFLPMMVGEEVYQLMRRVKQSWDPAGIFNPAKIVDTPSMNTSLRYRAGQETPELDTAFDFSASGGFLRAVENCNGSADCRKSAEAGGTMCPSYMATRNEMDTTRARANILRETLSWGGNGTALEQLADDEVKKVLDLCLSCKGCKSECPSNVDMSKLKAEAMHQRHLKHGVPLRSRLFGHANRLNKLAMKTGPLAKPFLQGAFSGLTKSMMGVAPQRQLPPLAKTALRTWYNKHRQELKTGPYPNGKVYFFADAFTDLLDAEIGIKAISLLTKLGYQVEIPAHKESGRTYLSKGLLKEARSLAAQNVALLGDLVSQEHPLIGVEPSAILTFKDEYPDLLRGPEAESAQKLAQNVLLIDDFIWHEFQAGKINANQFTTAQQTILLHGHCHQKALGSVAGSAGILEIPENYSVQLIPSGCCGMAGSFGYEKEHYEISKQIAELVLVPTIKNQSADIIAAPGTSCRHQIADFAGRKAKHPVEILYEAFISEA